MILLITNTNDVTTDYIVAELRKRQLSYYRLNTNRLFCGIDLTLNRKGIFLYDYVKKEKVDFNDVTCVYYRRPMMPSYAQLSLNTAEKDFLKNETWYLLDAVYRFLDNRFWISYPQAIRNADNKLYQLEIARKLGFDVPEYIATNRADDVRTFVKAYHQVIIKSVKNARMSDMNNLPKFLYTTRLHQLTDEDYKKITMAPIYLQREIAKKYDLRITVVGNQAFAVKIDSQNFPDTVTDWRYGEHTDLELSLVEAPKDLIEKCQRFRQFFNLEFSAFDFVVGQDDKYYFLEDNANGQWAWLDVRLQTGIAEAICNYLEEYEKNQ